MELYLGNLSTRYHNDYYILNILYIFAYYMHSVHFCIVQFFINAQKSIV